MNNLSRIEQETIILFNQETIILFNEAESTATIETHNGRLKRKLDRLAAERPNEATAQNGNDGARNYTVPKRWVTVNAPRVMSDEQKAICAEWLAEQRRIKSEVR